MSGPIDPNQSPSLKSWGEPADLPHGDVVVPCGWGRMIFAHTFAQNEDIATTLQQEQEGQRDVALYLRDPQVVVACAPDALFIDPSFTFRLPLPGWRTKKRGRRGAFTIRTLGPGEEPQVLETINAIYRARGMVPLAPGFLEEVAEKDFMTYWIAEDAENGALIAACMGLDHVKVFDDPEGGTSLWALAVDPQAPHAAVGLHMVQAVATAYRRKGRKFLDLSVLHSNTEAIDLYKKLGFVQVPVFCVKHKNAINADLYTPGTAEESTLNPYARLITDAARRRGIKVEILDPVDHYFRLTHGGRSITCRESLSELTSSIAMSRCSDKATTTRILQSAGLSVPEQKVAGRPATNLAFLKKHGALVVKPAVGEQGAGITVGVKTPAELVRAVESARKLCSKVLLEPLVAGMDLRVIVIDDAVVAAAVRRPAAVVGDGVHTVLELVHKQSRRRAQATGGESKIPVDRELRRTVLAAGYALDDVLPEGESLTVRRTANLHTGGTIHDVTSQLHPDLASAARKAARALGIPVTGLDFLVTAPDQPDYVIIEANERPGLANHEPQPTAERFLDFLFPQSRGRE
ncbi:MAG TPA: N-acetylglutaminylglutamine synthetase [Rhodospirillaceae bacterium]|jgi:GNAT-family acetyltransferase (TIGR03103 family)|nr:N-acetylglutaminylglutamine synthetase [Alphaproteobacteria bacterium]HBH26723.1 N-acetylglutaminylglutamine synthetase [Rhodospirillaceae bacterium]